jgi:hypothetical protein
MHILGNAQRRRYVKEKLPIEAHCHYGRTARGSREEKHVQGMKRGNEGERIRWRNDEWEMPMSNMRETIAAVVMILEGLLNTKYLDVVRILR